jgi:TonB family protein
MYGVMTKQIPSLVLFLAFLTVGAWCVATPIHMRGLQSQDQEKIYTASEVDVRANVKNRLERLPKRKSDCPDKVQVSLRVVLRKSGKVTDIAILKTSGCSYDQEAFKAAEKLRFDPALKGGQPVSQYSDLEYQTAPADSPNISVLTPNNQTLSPASLGYGLLLDNSGSLGDDLKHITAAAETIIEANSASDEAFIVRFISSDKIETLQDFTSDKAKLLSSMKGLRSEGGQTAIIDAVYLAAQHLSQRNFSPRARRALVLITDGDERASYYHVDVLLNYLRQKQISVYILAYQNNVKKEQGSNHYERAIAFINSLAQESGGKVIVAEKGKEIEEKATEIVRLLHGG